MYNHRIATSSLRCRQQRSSTNAAAVALLAHRAQDERRISRYSMSCRLGREPERAFIGTICRGPAEFSLGFMKPSETFRFGHPGAFGAPGAGGSMGYADPQTGIGYGYVTNRMGISLEGDPRGAGIAARSTPVEPSLAARSLNVSQDLTWHMRRGSRLRYRCASDSC